MLQQSFQFFVALDATAFSALTTDLGFVSAAVYCRQSSDRFSFVIGSSRSEGKEWPAFLELGYLDFTTKQKTNLPLGWHPVSFEKLTKLGLANETFVYFPEQALRVNKLLVVVKFAKNATATPGILDGGLEAMCSRISLWLGESELRQFIHESVILEQAKRLSLQTQTLIDHELRTPLTNIKGYAYMIATSNASPEIMAHAKIVESQSDVALAAVEKLALTIRSGARDESEENSDFDLIDIIAKAKDEAVQRDRSESNDDNRNCEVTMYIERGIDISFTGNESLLKRGLSEVIHNAIVYSQNSPVSIRVERKGNSAIIDIEDAGTGVPVGTEDLIFLQFFRGHNNRLIRRGHRGLGLGLFFARFAAEQHFGQLIYVPRTSKGAMFRFLLPLNAISVKTAS